MQAEYIAKITGDTSGLEKAINKANGKMKKLENDEVLIKLNYDGNVKGFNAEFDKILKACPDLTIQFQYNANQKMLDKEMDKLKQLQALKLDIETDNVNNKINSMVSDLNKSAQNGVSEDIIESKIKGIYKYANTVKDLGGDIKGLLEHKIFDAISDTEYEKTFEKLLNINLDNLKLFNFSDSIENEISRTESRINDFKEFLDKLEEQGASKSGFSSDLENVEEEIKILRENIADMKEDLKTLSGEAFEDMTQQIKDTNEQLSNALKMVEQLKSILSSNKIKLNNSIGGVVNQWQDEDITKTNERYTAFNSQTKQTSGAHLAAEAEGVGMKLIREAIDEMGNEADGVIHSHPLEYAAFSDDDIERYFQLFEDTKGKIFSQVVTSTKQAISLDMSKIDTSKKDEILQQIRDEYQIIDDTLIGNISGKSEELKNVVNNILNNTQSEYPELISIIQANVDSMFKNLGNSFSWMDFSDAFDDLLVKSAKDVAKAYPNPKEMIGNLMPDMGLIMAKVEDTMLSPLSNQAQQLYQEILQKVFTNPEFLKAGETSAIKIQALSDFIDWGSVEDSAREAARKAADALQKTQDSNSPAELTKPLGKDFGEGYAEGIREAMPDIVKACREIVLGAYKAIKEANESDDEELKVNTGGLSENFINIFRAKLEESIPAIQEEIKGIFSKINLADGNDEIFKHIGEGIIEPIVEGLRNANSGESFVKALESIINDAFSKVVLNIAAQSLVNEIQNYLDLITEQKPFRISHFDADSNSLVVSIQNALDNSTFNINLDGTVKDLSAALNTTAENVKLTFIDVIKWIREANEIQKKNDAETDERVFFYNSKTGETSNPTVVGQTGKVKGEVSKALLEKELKKGKTFDTDIHWHGDWDTAAPSPADLVSDFVKAYNDGITKFAVGAQKDIAEIDFNKIANDKEDLINKTKNFLKINSQQVMNLFDEYLNTFNSKDKNGINKSNTINLQSHNSLVKDLSKIDALKPDQILRLYGKYVGAMLQLEWKSLGKEMINSANAERKNNWLQGNQEYDKNKLFEQNENIIKNIKSFSDKSKDGKYSLFNTDIFNNLNDSTKPFAEKFISNYIDNLSSSLETGLKNQDIISNKDIKYITEQNLKNTLLNNGVYDTLKNNPNFINFQDAVLQYVQKNINDILVSATTGLNKKEKNDIAQLAGQQALKNISGKTLLGDSVTFYSGDEIAKKYGGKGVISDSSQLSLAPTLPQDFQQQLQDAIQNAIQSVINNIPQLISDSLSNSDIGNMIVTKIQDAISDITLGAPIKLWDFEVDTDSIVVQIRDALKAETFKINISGDIQDIATVLNTSAENVKLTFIDALKWMREADQYQMNVNKSGGRERVLYFNSKTGEFSNPTIYGNEGSAPWFFDMVEDYMAKGDIFDTHLHSHIYDDFASPSTGKNNAEGSSIGDVEIFFNNAMNKFTETFRNISKFVVAAQNELAVFDFSNIASNAEELETYLENWFNANITEIQQVVENTDTKDIRQVAGEYVARLKESLQRKIYDESDSVVPSDKIPLLIDKMFEQYYEPGYFNHYLTNLIDGNMQPFREIYEDINPAFGYDFTFSDDISGIIDLAVDEILQEFRKSVLTSAKQGVSFNEDKIQKMVSNIAEYVLDGNNYKDLGGIVKDDISNTLVSYIGKQFSDESIYSVKTGVSSWAEAGSMALKQLISENDLIGKIVKYYSLEEFEKVFGASFPKNNFKQYNKTDFYNWGIDDDTGMHLIDGLTFDELNAEQIVKWKERLLKFFPELLENQAEELYNYMRDEYGNDANFDVNFIKKINGFVAQNARQQQGGGLQNTLLSQLGVQPTIPTDFLKQLQTIIDDSGKYVIKVYGELVEDFKVNVQSAIDKLGLFTAKIEGFPYSDFHDSLQTTIDFLGNYHVNIEGQLINTFKEALQQLIDELGIFTIQVTPDVKKGGGVNTLDNNEIESDTNQTSESPEDIEATTKAYITKTEAIEQLYNQLKITKKAAGELVDANYQPLANGRFKIDQESLNQLIASKKESSTVEGSATTTTTALSQENELFKKIAKSAQNAADAKKKFAEANGDVLKSIIDSLTALNAEGDGFNNLNKIINNLANNKDDRITNLIANLTSLRNVLTQTVDEDAFINAIKEIASQGDSLKDVAAVLKASKEDVEKAQKATGKTKNVIPKKDIKSTEKDINSLKTRIEKLGNTDLLNELNGIKSAFDSIGDDADKLKAVKQSMEALTSKTKIAEEAIETQAKDAKELVDNYNKLAANTNKLKTLDPNSKAAKMLQEENEKLEKRNEEIKNKTYTEQQDLAIQEAKRNLDLALAGAEDKKTQATLKAAEAEEKARIAHENRRNSLRAQASELLKNGKINATYGTQIRQMIRELSDTNIAENKLTEISNKLKEIRTQANLTGKSGKTLFQMLKGRMSGLLTYLGTFASFYRIVGYIRSAFSTIKELDTQLVDLRKTTTMTTTELNQFYYASSDVAKQLGVTTSEIISQAAAWSRLGYSSKEAATEMAQISSQFASISPGMTTENATDYLVSTMKAFEVSTDEVERKVLDNVNKIGKKIAETYGNVWGYIKPSR